jgi:hypothetical protein
MVDRGPVADEHNSQYEVYEPDRELYTRYVLNETER